MRRSPLARPLTALVAAVLVSGALAGCSGFSLNGDCRPALEPGDASSIVTASGDVGEEPAIEFPTPLRAEEPQRSVLIEGDGDAIASGEIVDVDLTVLDGLTGEVLQASEYGDDAPSGRYTAGNSNGALGEALLCATPGSRISVAGPIESFQSATDVSSAEGDEQAEGSGAFYVIVIDVLKVWIGKANGINQLPQDGMPTVVTAVDGTPGVTVSTQTAPTKLRVATIKAGAGEALAAGDSAIMHVRQWTWSVLGAVSIGELDTWKQPNPTPGTYAVDTEVPVLDALVGSKVGSQMLVVVPAEDGAGGASIYVFDILGIDHDDQ